MGMRNSQDPYGSHASLVDRVIGNAYEVVKAVYLRLGEIGYIASNMEAVVITAKNLPDTSTVMVPGRLGQRGERVEIAMSSKVTMDTLVASSVMILDAAGNAYQDGNGNFLFSIKNGKLIIKLMSDAPTTMVSAEVRWLITYRIR